MRVEGSTAGKETLVGEPKFHHLSKCTMKPTKYPLRLDVQCSVVLVS